MKRRWATRLRSCRSASAAQASTASADCQMAAFASAWSSTSKGYRERKHGPEGLRGGVVRRGGKGFLAAIRLNGVILPGPAAIPAAFDYLYHQGGGR